MRIVGIEHEAGEVSGVATIDVWYSTRRRAWIVERLDMHGSQLGPSYRCHDEMETSECVAEWLRAHAETHVLSPRDLSAAEHRILAKPARKRAA